jgi:hypothetical protein
VSGIFGQKIYQNVIFITIINPLNCCYQTAGLNMDCWERVMSLCCLIYTSISTQKMSDDELKMMLKKSRKRNEKSGVTGMLLYREPFFMQILEGEDNVISGLFDRIKKDPRHHKTSPIYKKGIEQRHFKNWTMGFEKLNNENIEGFSDVLKKTHDELLNLYPNKVCELLDKFKHEILF